MIIDTHCHFDMMPNPEWYIQNAERKGEIIIGMTNLPSHFEMGCVHVQNFRHIRLALGFHPQLAKESIDELVSFGKLVNKTSYIGEIGLDFSKNYVDSKEKQIYAFRSVLNYIKGDNKKAASDNIRSCSDGSRSFRIRNNNYTLNLKSTMSPSRMTYSLPSERTRPFSLAAL